MPTCSDGRSLQLLDREGLPVVEFPKAPGPMTAATSPFYKAVPTAS
jgi:hypothetical protein